MKNKRMYIAYCSALLIVVYSIIKSPSLTHAQQQESLKNNKLASDLSLDLALAEQNSAPQQKEILASQITNAKLTTANNEVITITPQNIVPEEVKTESTQYAIHPEQTTSEQVINTQTTVGGNGEPEQKNTINNQTDIKTDDNAAPAESSDAPTPTIGASQNPSTNTDGAQPTTESSQPSSGNNEIIPQHSPDSIPFENGSTQTTTPQDSTVQPDQNSSNDQPPKENVNGDENSSIHGATIKRNTPWWNMLFNKFLKLF